MHSHQNHHPIRSFPLLPAAIALLLGLALAPAAAFAQCTPVPGSGCPNTAPASCSGSSSLGQTLTVGCPPGIGSHLTVFGTVAPSPTPLPSAIVCGGGAGCTLGCTPLLVFRGATLNIPIPNDPALRNAVFCVQCVLYDFNRSCVVPTQAVSFTIT